MLPTKIVGCGRLLEKEKVSYRPKDTAATMLNQDQVKDIADISQKSQFVCRGKRAGNVCDQAGRGITYERCGISAVHHVANVDDWQGGIGEK